MFLNVNNIDSNFLGQMVDSGEIRVFVLLLVTLRSFAFDEEMQ